MWRLKKKEKSFVRACVAGLFCQQRLLVPPWGQVNHEKTRVCVCVCLYEARGRLRWQSARTRVVMLLHFGLKRSVDDFGLRRPHSSGQKKKERDSFPSPSSSSLSQSISLSLTVWREKAIFENSCRPALQLFIITITTGMDGFKKPKTQKQCGGGLWSTKRPASKNEEDGMRTAWWNVRITSRTA